jgi:hypothetical protein
MGLVVLVVILVLCAATVPRWPYSRRWGYRPAGALGVMWLAWLLLLMLALIPWYGPIY